MTVTELIEKYVEQSPDRGERPFLTNFAIELLTLMKGSGAPCSFVAQQNAVIVRTIDKALEELRK